MAKVRGARRWVALVVGCAALVSAGEVRAEGIFWDWNIFGGFHLHSNDSTLGNSDRRSNISHSVVLGPRLTQHLGSWVAIEGELALGATNSTDGEADLLLIMPRMQARIDARPDAGFAPFLIMGGGSPSVLSQHRSVVDSDITLAGYAGAGFDFNLGSALRVRLEGRWVAVPGLGEPLLAHEAEFLLTVSRRSRDRGKVKAVAPEVADLDGDGVPDESDKCPDVAEDIDRHQDSDGCPDRDNDGDGVLDGLDRCPKEIENENGFEDDDGCTDQIPEDVRLVEGVLSGIRFKSGSDEFTTGSYVALGSLANVLLKYPSLRIEVIAHVAEQEDAEAAMALSQQRAQAVRAHIAELGVGEGRILPTGRGSEDPVADNATAAGRRANERIEVRIIVGLMEP